MIVGLTGSESEEHNQMALAKGQDHVLGKPFSDKKQFTRIISKFIREKETKSIQKHDTPKEYPKYIFMTLLSIS